LRQNLISKKELLKLMNISYGQLYRWKRKNLIPEEWFIKKATRTGQETFFPREKIVERIQKIKELKPTLSLDELELRFSPRFNEVYLDKDQLLQNNIVTLQVLNILYEHYGPFLAMHIEHVVYGYMLQSLVNQGEITYEEASSLMKVIKEIFTTEFGKNYEVIFIRKLGVTSCFVVSANSEVFFDRDTKIVARLNVTNYKEELINKLVEAGIFK